MKSTRVTTKWRELRPSSKAIKNKLSRVKRWCSGKNTKLRLMMKYALKRLLCQRLSQEVSTKSTLHRCNCERAMQTVCNKKVGIKLNRRRSPTYYRWEPQKKITRTYVTVRQQMQAVIFSRQKLAPITYLSWIWNIRKDLNRATWKSRTKRLSWQRITIKSPRHQPARVYWISLTLKTLRNAGVRLIIAISKRSWLK